MTQSTLCSRRKLLGATTAGAVSLLAAGAVSWLASRGALAQGQEQPMPKIVDPHVHVWKNDAKYPWPAELATPPKDDALPEPLLELMKDNGVDHTVIVHVIYYRWDCRYAGDVIKANRKQFRGVCRVNPTAKSAPDDLVRWVRDYGFHGVRLSPYEGPDGDWINDRARMDAIWSRTARLKIPMCVLCPISRISDVDKVIERHPHVDVCIDHMADCPIDQPDNLKKLLALARYDRVHVKISHMWSLSKEEYPYRDTHDQIQKLYDAFGPRRLMWGSDWPAVETFCGYAQALSLYRGEIKFFNDDDRQWILGGTALKLWPFA